MLPSPTLGDVDYGGPVQAELFFQLRHGAVLDPGPLYLDIFTSDETNIVFGDFRSTVANALQRGPMLLKIDMIFLAGLPTQIAVVVGNTRAVLVSNLMLLRRRFAIEHSANKGMT